MINKLKKAQKDGLVVTCCGVPNKAGGGQQDWAFLEENITPVNQYQIIGMKPTSKLSVRKKTCPHCGGEL